jgi:hypothetical protein
MFTEAATSFPSCYVPTNLASSPAIREIDYLHGNIHAVDTTVEEPSRGHEAKTAALG